MTTDGNVQASTFENAEARWSYVLVQISSIAGRGPERKRTIIANALVLSRFSSVKSQ